MKVELWAPQFRILIERLPARIGRSAGADVRLHDPEISRHHCQIEQRNGALVIRDLQSTNGTFVNGCRVAEAALHSGDQVSLGQTQFLARYGRDTSCTSGAEVADGVPQCFYSCSTPIEAPGSGNCGMH